MHGAGPGGVAAALQCDHRLTAAAASSHCSSCTFRCQHVDPGPRRVFRPLLLQLLHFVGQETIDVGGGISDRWVWVVGRHSGYLSIHIRAVNEPSQSPN